LKAKHVIHAVIMGQDLKASESSIRGATRSSLQAAEKKGINSIAFPALGTDTGGLSPHVAAKAMLEETIAFLENSRTIRQILFVLQDQNAYDAFRKQVEAIFSIHKTR
jgi:O-acetyl-ADP-ribose deacetylase (regulator of RNase III)